MSDFRPKSRPERRSLTRQADETFFVHPYKAYTFLRHDPPQQACLVKGNFVDYVPGQLGLVVPKRWMTTHKM